MIGGIATELAGIGSQVQQLLRSIVGLTIIRSQFWPFFWIVEIKTHAAGLGQSPCAGGVQDCDKIVQAHGSPFNPPELCLDWKFHTILRWSMGRRFAICPNWTGWVWSFVGWPRTVTSCGAISTQSNLIDRNCSRVVDFPQLSHNPVNCKKWDPRLRQDFKILKMTFSAVVAVRLDCGGPSGMGRSLPSTPDPKPVGGPLG